jgi:hypothetical protein
MRLGDRSKLKTDYRQTQQHLQATFESDEIREWVENQLSGRVLNACCGHSKLQHSGEIVRNDIDESIDAQYHVDVVQLAAELEPESFKTVVFDPPWTLYQANMRYDGNHVRKDGSEIDATDLPQPIRRDKTQAGHARLAKDGFDHLLKKGGKVIQLSYNGTCMPQRLGYDRKRRVMFDPLGEGKTLIGSTDEKVQTKLREQ